MRTFSTCVFVVLHLFAIGQVISFHDDSLKINKIYIDARITPKQLDLLLGAKHTKLKTKSDVQIKTHTGIKVKQVTYYYPALGLYFRTYKDDASKFALGLKLTNAIDPKDEVIQKLIKPFAGYLFIVGNDMARYKSVNEIKLLPNVSVSFQESYPDGKKTIVGGEILYQKDIIRLSIDKKTQEITAIYFYHNFKR
ncbi:MAG: hypothetical protein ABJB16_15780 [Saprospiraceae bacterium]